jgi:hypothetical protein
MPLSRFYSSCPSPLHISLSRTFLKRFEHKQESRETPLPPCVSAERALMMFTHFVDVRTMSSQLKEMGFNTQGDIR